VYPTRAATVGPDCPKPDPVTVAENATPTPCGRPQVRSPIHLVFQYVGCHIGTCGRFVVARISRRGPSKETACVRLAVAAWLDTVADSVKVRPTPAASLHLVEGVWFRGSVFWGGEYGCGFGQGVGFG